MLLGRASHERLNSRLGPVGREGPNQSDTAIAGDLFNRRHLDGAAARLYIFRAIIPGRKPPKSHPGGPTNQPDPRLPLNCQTCGKPLQHIATNGEAERCYLYLCVKHGYVVLTSPTNRPYGGRQPLDASDRTAKR